LLPFGGCQPQAGALSQSMFPTLTVHPGMSVLPAGMSKALQGFVPSKLPF
jgi:hypothetical protein